MNWKIGVGGFILFWLLSIIFLAMCLTGGLLNTIFTCGVSLIFCCFFVLGAWLVGVGVQDYLEKK